MVVVMNWNLSVVEDWKENERRKNHQFCIDRLGVFGTCLDWCDVLNTDSKQVIYFS